jgi:uncharacterized protein YdcH (DUF465 family)
VPHFVTKVNNPLYTVAQLSPSALHCQRIHFDCNSTLLTQLFWIDLRLPAYFARYLRSQLAHIFPLRFYLYIIIMAAEVIDTFQQRSYSSGNTKKRFSKSKRRHAFEPTSTHLGERPGEQARHTKPTISAQSTSKTSSTPARAYQVPKDSHLTQECQLTTLEYGSKIQSRIIANLTSQNLHLKDRLTDALATGKSLLERFKDMTAKHDSVVEQYNELNRTTMRLKKSDRAKGKVQQRNLSLKAIMGAHICSGKGREDALLEALALANERIEELEGAGETLLDALEKHDGDDCSSDGENEDKDEEEMGVFEAQARFRSVLEDEAFHEQKELYEGLLDT